MDQWVQNPTAHTALDDILPCMDNATAQETLLRSKEVTSQLVGVVNQVITNVSNINFAPNFTPLFYNQSGPLMPTLCNPFNPDLTDRVCRSGEVDLNNATEVKLNDLNSFNIGIFIQHTSAEFVVAPCDVLRNYAQHPDIYQIILFCSLPSSSIF